MKKKNIVILVLILLVLIGTGVGGFFLIKGQMSQKIYKEKMEEGRKYLDRMKYEEAIAAFEFALEENPEDENAYISIYRVRVAQGEVELAKDILRKGFRETKSERIAELLENYLSKTEAVQTDADGEELVETLEAVSEEITMNTAMIQKLEKYNYTSYEKEFGRYASNEMQGDSLEITHSKIQAVFVYQNASGEDKSINSAKKLPTDTAKPAYIRVQNLGLLFRDFESGITFERLQEIIGTKVTCAYSEEAGFYTDAFTYANCSIEIECEENGDIVKASAWNKIIPPKAEAEDGKVSVDGVILNAVTGDGLADAELVFEPDDRTMETGEAATDRAGSFSAELEPGIYQVEVSCDGFITDSFELEVEADTPVSGISFPLSPILSTGEIRIVLTWNSFPEDLDSYLEGTTVTGKEVDIYYGRTHARDGNDNLAVLDVDETSGFGPETTTIYADGTYHFYVKDFGETGQISSSGAQVKVYMGDGGAPEVFDVPQGSGNVWDVFTIENGTIHSINTITD